MVMCENALTCLQNCPPEIFFLVAIGALVIYGLVAGLIYYLLNLINEEYKFTDRASCIFIGILFPVALPALALILIVYWLVLWIAFPFIGATKRDLKESEARIMESLGSKKAKIKSALMITPKIEEFKAGDLVTGIKGNPGNFQHLYEGCVCRVIDPNYSKDKIELVLIDHKDFEAQKEYIGTIYYPQKRFMTKIDKKRRNRPTGLKYKKRSSRKRRR